MSNPKEMMNNFNNGIKEIASTNGEALNEFMKFVGANYKDGVVDAKTKELIAIGIAVYARCEHCIVHHVQRAYAAGATKEELMESAFVAVSFGGGPSLTLIATLLKDAVNTFAPDFNK